MRERHPLPSVGYGKGSLSILGTGDGANGWRRMKTRTQKSGAG